MVYFAIALAGFALGLLYGATVKSEAVRLYDEVESLGVEDYAEVKSILAKAKGIL